MRRNKFFVVIFLRCILLFVFYFQCITISLAWGVLGHRVTAEIAASYLTKKARDKIKEILGNESMAMASTWGDFIKSDSTYRYLGSWHYVDFDSGINYKQMKDYLGDDKEADAFTKLNFLIKELKNKSLSRDKKRMYLRLLIHITGDLHQPFHVSQKGDHGGNGLTVLWFGNNSNIHKVWDEQLIEFQQLSFTEYTHAINFTSLQQRAVWQKDPISLWLFESYTLSGKLRNELNQGDGKLNYSYNYKNVGILNEQLLKGGVRLAGLLNSIFS